MKEPSSELLKAAYVSKAQGLKGALFIRPLNPSPEWPPSIKEIFIAGNFFSVQRFRPHKKGFIFELESCTGRAQAEALKKQPVFLPKKYFSSGAGAEDFYLAELLDFSVEALNYGKLGLVEAFQSQGDQDFLLVKRGEAEESLLIPFSKAYVENINFSKKTIKLDLPENFLEVFS